MVNAEATIRALQGFLKTYGRDATVQLLRDFIPEEASVEFSYISENDYPEVIERTKVSRIHAVAIKLNGIIYTLPRPCRHHHVIMMMAACVEVTTPIRNDEQGFLLEDGRFADRLVAARFAVWSGQIDRTKYQPNALFSEDVW